MIWSTKEGFYCFIVLQQVCWAALPLPPSPSLLLLHIRSWPPTPLLPPSSPPTPPLLLPPPSFPLIPTLPLPPCSPHLFPLPIAPQLPPPTLPHTQAHQIVPLSSSSLSRWIFKPFPTFKKTIAHQIYLSTGMHGSASWACDKYLCDQSRVSCRLRAKHKVNLFGKKIEMFQFSA